MRFSQNTFKRAVGKEQANCTENCSLQLEKHWAYFWRDRMPCVLLGDTTMLSWWMIRGVCHQRINTSLSLTALNFPYTAIGQVAYLLRTTVFLVPFICASPSHNFLPLLSCPAPTHKDSSSQVLSYLHFLNYFPHYKT